MIKFGLPLNWVGTPFSSVLEINPRVDKSLYEDLLDVSFVSMSAVEAETGNIDVKETRKFSEVKKGYTGFLEGDVLFAKITPCMENGKAAVVPELANNLGFGSTEFHVLRAPKGVCAEYLYYFVSSKIFRWDAEHNMTGAVGQRRVPTSYLENSELPLPPVNEQKRIVAKIEELFSELDNGVAALKTAREQLKVYRQALLKHAFEGKLTADWRKANKLETSENFFVRIRQERESYLEGLEKKGSSEAARYLNKIARSNSEYPVRDLPRGSIWVSLIDICSLIVDCHNKTAPYESEGIWLIRTPCIRDGKICLNEEARFISDETYNYWAKRCPPEPGDIIFTREAPMGEAGIVPQNVKLCMGQRMMLIRPPKLMSSEYLLYALMEPKFLARMNEMAIGTGVKHLRVGDVEQLCIPLFPEAEQAAIVQKLEEQFSVIDEEERDIDVVMRQAETLRQSILKKAFSGQLVPQDPNDEPASELLARINAEKAAQIVKKAPEKSGRKIKRKEVER